MQANPNDEHRKGIPPWLTSLPVIGGAALAVVVGLVLVIVALGSGDDDEPTQAVAPTAAAPTATALRGESGGLIANEPAAQEGAPLNLERPIIEANLNMESVGADDRFVIEKFGIDAPLTYRSVGLDGMMPNPDGPDDVAYYDFSAWPGKGGAPGRGGNAVFAGHVDSGSKPCQNGTVPPPCQAVLWDLNGLKVGDEIQVRVGGEVFAYSVTSNQPVDAAAGAWDQIVSATAEESITIITCAGNFNRETGSYSDRQVVVAVRS